MHIILNCSIFCQQIKYIKKASINVRVSLDNTNIFY
jgi:hypothetical protein